jgi:hypothetical protein
MNARLALATAKYLCRHRTLCRWRSSAAGEGGYNIIRGAYVVDELWEV